MNVLIVYAHPEPRSLNGALKDFAVARLEAAGHAVQVSDLYAMGWKAVLDAGDSLEREASERFDPSATSLRAFENGWQSVDIAGEQDKLRWADTLILQFPLWWFSMPAILKGWIDRVYACGFAYGVGEHSDSHWGDRYGEGRMQGKRAMLVVTAGGWESHYAARVSTDRWTTCCSPSITASCITPASRYCRRSSSIAAAGSTRSVSPR